MFRAITLLSLLSRASHSVPRRICTGELLRRLLDEGNTRFVFLSDGLESERFNLSTVRDRSAFRHFVIEYVIFPRPTRLYSEKTGAAVRKTCFVQNSSSSFRPNQHYCRFPFCPTNARLIPNTFGNGQ